MRGEEEVVWGGRLAAHTIKHIKIYVYMYVVPAQGTDIAAHFEYPLPSLSLVSQTVALPPPPTHTCTEGYPIHGHMKASLHECLLVSREEGWGMG